MSFVLETRALISVEASRPSTLRNIRRRQDGKVIHTHRPLRFQPSGRKTKRRKRTPTSCVTEPRSYTLMRLTFPTDAPNTFFPIPHSQKLQLRIASTTRETSIILCQTTLAWKQEATPSYKDRDTCGSHRQSGLRAQSYTNYHNRSCF